jgi:hypothetical protein
MKLWSLSAIALVLGCHATPPPPLQLAPQPDPVRLSMKPAVIPAGSSALVVVESPGADSIALESLDGLDRWWSDGPRLSARVSSSLGDSVPVQRYATRGQGRLFNILKKPMRLTVCRKGTCREYYRDLLVNLPERNLRSVALTGGWGTSVSRRALTGSDRSVLLKEVVNNSIWSLQAELATKALSAVVRGFYSPREYGGALDLSRRLSGGDGFGYGIAIHVGAAHDDWLVRSPGRPLTDRTAYQVSVGPGIMLRGLTASSQIGLSTDGRETLQVLTTRVSINGHLTEVLTPVTVVLEKTFAFGGSGIVPARRYGVDRLTLAVNLVRDFALRGGLSSRQSTWPGRGQAYDVRATELYYSIGGEYTLSW